MPKINSIERSVQVRGGFNQPKMSPRDTAAAAIGAGAADLAGVLIEKDERDERLRQANFIIDSQLQWDETLSTMQSEYPEGVGYTEAVTKSFNGFMEKSTENVAPRYRDDFKENLLRFKGQVVSQAISNEARLKTSYQTGKFEDQLNVIANRARSEGVIDPLLYESVDEKINLYDVSPEIKESFREKLYNDTGSAYLQGLISRSPQAAIDELKSGNWGDLDREVYNKLLSTAESTKRTNDIKLEKVKFSDPVKYVNEKSPLVVKFDDLLKEQERIGVPPANRSVMSNAAAEVLAAQIQGVENVDQFLAQRAGLKDEFGDHYDVAVKDLYKNGLPMSFQMLFSLDENENPDQMEALVNIARSGREDVVAQAKNDAKGRNDNFSEDIERKVLENVSETMSFLNAEGLDPGLRVEFGNNLVALAGHFYSGGASADDAAEMATSWISSQYEVFSHNGVDFRIPVDSTYEADDIYFRLQRKMQSLSDVVEFPGSNLILKRQNLERLEGGAYFVLNREQNGVAVLSIDGSPIYNRYDGVTENGLLIPAADALQVEFLFSELEAEPERSALSPEKQSSLEKREVDEMVASARAEGLTERQIKMEISALKARQKNRRIERNFRARNEAR